MIGILMLLAVILSGCGDLVKSVEEGRAYGKDHTLGECDKEAMARLNACEGESCAILNVGFPKGCVKTARSDPKFCATNRAGLKDAIVKIKRECSGHRFEKACYKYKQAPIARCLNEGAS